MYESRYKPLATKSIFLRRVLLCLAVAWVIILFALGLGMLGYHFICSLPWIDAFYNSSMILTGMGPVATMSDSPSKLFASFYALFSGFVVLVVIGVTAAPPLHRLLHVFHLDEEAFDEDDKDAQSP